MTFSLESLVELQEVDGSWVYSYKLESLLSSVIQKAQFAPPSSFEASIKGGVRKAAWLTALVLWILDKHFGEKKGEWKRIAIKANNYLKKAGLSNKDISSLL